MTNKQFVARTILLSAIAAEVIALGVMFWVAPALTAAGFGVLGFVALILWAGANV